MMKFGRIFLGMMLISLCHAASIPDTPKARGAVWFMNYCAGCHRLQYMPWSRVMTDLTLSSQAVMDVPPFHLTVLDLQASSGLSSEDAQQWFGKTPPDLSKISQLRGKRWLQAYLLGFYPDASRPYGASNHQISNVMMPNVLFPVQHHLTPQQFANVVTDIVSFLDYVADPTQSLRHKIGLWVVSFFGIGCVLIGLYWRYKIFYATALKI